ncbi:MAG TPA: helix-turn-helix transcriptional regulator [Candidatus Nitrosocosmicus sp.]|nr:helix-turn-helix transcriptional regulator [Candidatus Nitrosocosmicus sp.]
MINHRKDSDEFGQNLRKIRKQKGLMQIDVAVATDLHRTYISRIETGKARITFGIMCLLIRGLDITSDEVIENEEINFGRNLYYSLGLGGDEK